MAAFEAKELGCSEITPPDQPGSHPLVFQGRKVEVYVSSPETTGYYPDAGGATDRARVSLRPV